MPKDEKQWIKQTMKDDKQCNGSYTLLKDGKILIKQIIKRWKTIDQTNKKRWQTMDHTSHKKITNNGSYKLSKDEKPLIKQKKKDDKQCNGSHNL